MLSKCTQSKEHQKLIQRLVWENYLEEADHLRHTQENESIYARRKETIERVFADAKEKNGMRWTTLRGLKKLSMQAMPYFCFHEFEEDSQLDIEKSRNGVKWTSGEV